MKVLKKDGELNNNEDFCDKLCELLEIGKKYLDGYYQRTLYYLRSEILMLGIVMNKYNFEIYVEFLKDSNNESEFLNKKEVQKNYEFCLPYPIFMTDSKYKYNDDEIIKKYFSKNYSTEFKNIENLKQYFKEESYKQLIFLNKMLEGKENYLKDDNPYSNEITNEIINQKCLNLLPYNKNYFKKGSI